MLKKRFCSAALALCLLSMSGLAQSAAIDKLSLETRQTLMENGIIKVDLNQANMSKLSRKMVAEQMARAPKVASLSCFVEASDPAVWERLRAEGCDVRTVAGPYATVTIPIDKVLTVAEMADVQRVAVGRKLQMKMDQARPLMNIGDTYQATDKHPAITGKGVIVGVVDGAMDYRHPTFYSADGTTYRVKNALEQTYNKATTLTTTEEYDTQEKILAKQFSSDSHSMLATGHGTHVASMAAGSGYTNPKYQGVAYESDIMLVATTMLDPDVVDGVTHIFGKAAEADSLLW